MRKSVMASVLAAATILLSSCAALGSSADPYALNVPTQRLPDNVPQSGGTYSDPESIVAKLNEYGLPCGNRRDNLVNVLREHLVTCYYEGYPVYVAVTNYMLQVTHIMLQQKSQGKDIEALVGKNWYIVTDNGSQAHMFLRSALDILGGNMDV